ncbi:MAG: hypothetical protein R6W75_05595 [Smithellaceae bacterium]
MALDVVAAFFQRFRDRVEGCPIVVKNDNQDIRPARLVFVNAFNFFEDTTYPAIRASGKAARHSQLNNPLGSQGSIRPNRQYQKRQQ